MSVNGINILGLQENFMNDWRFEFLEGNAIPRVFVPFRYLITCLHA